MTTIRSTGSKIDIPLHFDMGVFGPAGAVSAFIPGTTARILELLPFTNGLTARLYATAGRWVKEDAKHFMPKSAHRNDLTDNLRGIAADCHLESAFYFANAGRVQLSSGGENAMRLGLLNYLEAKDQLDAMVELKDKPEFRLLQARIYQRIRHINHMNGDQSGVGWMTKELEIIKKGLSLLKDSPPSRTKSELTLRMIDASHEISDTHINEAKTRLKAGDAEAVKKHLKAAASINETIGNGLVGNDALEATIEAIDCYKAILANIHEGLSAEERISTLRSLSGAYRKAGEHYKDMQNLIGSAEMHYQAAAALEHAARIRHELAPSGPPSAEIQREYNESLHDLTSATRAFGDAGESKAATDLRAHMGNISSFLSGGRPQMPEPLRLGYTFRYPQISVARSVFDGNDASDGHTDEDLSSLRRLGRRLTPREKTAFLKHFADAAGSERAILELEQFVREHLNGGQASKRDAVRTVRQRGLRRTMEDLFGNAGSDTVDRIFIQNGGPEIDRRATLERRARLR